MRNIKRFLLNTLSYFNLVSETEDFDYIHQEILKGIPFKGTNLWILIFAIFLASVGLNMNSTAVIIGAMLISPLMGPINGMGYSIATYDFELLKVSIKNFTFAVVTSLITSTLYFAISPVSGAQSELLARTSPTIYDVLIALFGGLAGIIAISSKNKGNVIPGVAIATALMPPLCTAGYGLATLQPKFFFGAFYLFSINTIFIALSALWVSQLLNFPIRTIVDKQKKILVNRIIAGVTMAVLLPSFYFGYQLVMQEKFSQNANKLISNVGNYQGNYLMKSTIDAPNKKVELIYGGNELTALQIQKIIAKSKDFDLSDKNIIIKQGFNISDFVDYKNNDLDLASKEQIILLKKSLEKYELQEKLSEVLFNEIKVINPQVESLIYVENTFNITKDSLLRKTPSSLAIIKFKATEKRLETNEMQLKKWLETRLQKNRIKVIFEP